MPSNERGSVILTVFGTRPEAIKTAPVIKELQRIGRDGSIRCIVCVTAQHRQMLDQMLSTFDIRPDYDLNLMTQSQSPAQVAAAVLTELTRVMEVERPDWVVVQGDTTTVAAASLAAYYFGTKVAHVEAGLRTHDKWQPFPEEINRRIAGTIADIHFAPTPTAKSNLLREGVAEESIVVTGNTSIDALRLITAMPSPSGVDELIGPTKSAIGRVIVVTAHRRENFGAPLENICSAIRVLSHEYPDVRIVYPVHMNPEVNVPVTRLLSGLRNVILTEPMDYASMVHLMNASYIIMTDSGGIQEEAPGLGKPVIVLREVTERPEGVEAGVAKLVGTNAERILNGVRTLLDDESAYQKMARAVNPYGDGHAAERIVDELQKQGA